jgi:hypothetical protein
MLMLMLTDKLKGDNSMVKITTTSSGFGHHFLLPLIAIVAVGAIGLYMINSSSAATDGMTNRIAYRTADFIDSQGVVAHVDADETYRDKTSVLEALNYLGIHNVRSRNNGEGEVKNYLAANNVKFNFMTVIPKKYTPLSNNIPAVQQTIQDRVADILTNPRTGSKYVMSASYVEPLNEYDNKKWKDNRWQDALAAAQDKLWSMKPQITAQNPNTKILGPAFIGYQQKTSALALQAKNIGDKMDYGNVHSYPGGKPPETTLKPDDGRDGFVVPESELPTKVTDNIGQKLQHYSTRISGTKRVVVTEEGYHDYALQPKGLTYYTDPRAIGIYTPRVFLENFRIGVLRTYIYEMFDEQTHPLEYEKHFGLFTSSGKTRTPKAAATAVHNMNQLLSDTGANATTFTTGRLKYALSNQTSDIKVVLLQKSSGKFYMVVWKGESVFTPGDGPGKGRYVGPSPAVNHTLTFDKNRSVSAYNNGSMKRTALGASRKSYTVSVSAVPTILEIK